MATNKKQSVLLAKNDIIYLWWSVLRKIKRNASQPSLALDMWLAVDPASTGDRFCEVYIILFPCFVARRVGMTRPG